MTAGTILRREHLVAACLVGSVVVVVGFASGLGLIHPAAAGALAAPDATDAPSASQPAAAGNQGSAAGGSSGPVNYVGTPADVGIGGVALPMVEPTTSAQTAVDSGQTTAPTTMPTSTTPSRSNSPACQPGLLAALLNQVTTVVNGVPVVGSLAPQVTGTLFGTCSATTTDGPATTSATASGLLPLLIPTGGGS